MTQAFVESGTQKARTKSERVGFDAGLRKEPACRPSVRTLAYGYGHRRIFPTQLKTMGIDSRPLWTKLYPVFR